MSAHFDYCPICGRGVGCQHGGAVGEFYIPCCGFGHDLLDLGFTGELPRNEFEASRVWNRIVRKNSNSRKLIMNPDIIEVE